MFSLSMAQSLSRLDLWLLSSPSSPLFSWNQRMAIFCDRAQKLPNGFYSMTTNKSLDGRTRVGDPAWKYVYALLTASWDRLSKTMQRLRSED